MQAASLSQFGNLEFVFIELKQNTAALDKETLNDLKKLERTIKAAMASRKKLDTEFESIMGLLFSLRLKGLEWLGKDVQKITETLNEVGQTVQLFSGNPRLKKTGYHISQALLHNHRLVNYLIDNRLLTGQSLVATTTSNFTFESFIVALQLMPVQISKMVKNLLFASLKLEFVSISALILYTGEANCSDVKIKQLTALAKDAELEYLGYVDYLISTSQAELWVQDKNSWLSYGLDRLSSAYGTDEPDYDNVTVKEPNPEYTK